MYQNSIWELYMLGYQRCKMKYSLLKEVWLKRYFKTWQLLVAQMTQAVVDRKHNSLSLCSKDRAGNQGEHPTWNLRFFLLWKITPLLHLCSHLTNQDNDSRLNTLFLRGWNKIMCKIKYLRDLKASSECASVEDKIGALSSPKSFLDMKKRGTQVALSFLLPMQVRTLEDKGCCGVWISG